MQGEPTYSTDDDGTAANSVNTTSSTGLTITGTRFGNCNVYLQEKYGRYYSAENAHHLQSYDRSLQILCNVPDGLRLLPLSKLGETGQWIRDPVCRYEAS